MLFALHVAEEAGVERDDQVLALHDLRMARNAAQFLAATLLGEVRHRIAGTSDRTLWLAVYMNGPQDVPRLEGSQSQTLTP